MEANERERKRWKIILAVGIVLCFGPVLGDIGSIAVVQTYFDHSKNMRGPTPEDLTPVVLSLFGMAAGFAASVAGVLVVVWSCTKLGRLRNETPASR
jgi:hypothetical protein